MVLKNTVGRLCAPLPRTACVALQPGSPQHQPALIVSPAGVPVGPLHHRPPSGIFGGPKIQLRLRRIILRKRLSKKRFSRFRPAHSNERSRAASRARRSQIPHSSLHLGTRFLRTGIHRRRARTNFAPKNRSSDLVADRDADRHHTDRSGDAKVCHLKRSLPCR